MAYESRQAERFFAKAESAYGDTTYQTFLATDAVLLEALSFTPKNNRTVSPQRSGTPDELVSQDARSSCGWQANGLWAPSGALGTPSDYTELLKALLGAAHTTNLSTTVASGGSKTGAVLTSATGLQVGDVVVVTLPSGLREPTRIKTLNVATVTWDALTAIPANGAAVVSGVTYSLTTAKPGSLALGIHESVADVDEAVSGAWIGQGTLTLLDAGKPTLQLSGEAKQYFTTGITMPGSITTSEQEVTGLVGGFYVDDNAFIANQVALSFGQGAKSINRGIGVRYPVSYERNAKRSVGFSVDFYRGDYRIRDLAAASTSFVLRCIIGDTNGRMVGVVAPKVEPEMPEHGDDDGIRSGTVQGRAYATSGNDSLFLFEA